MLNYFLMWYNKKFYLKGVYNIEVKILFKGSVQYRYLYIIFIITVPSIMSFPGWLDSKASAYNAGDPGLIPGSGRSPREGNGNPLQYSSLENPMDRGDWWATVHGVAKSWTRLSDFSSPHFTSLSIIAIR